MRSDDIGEEEVDDVRESDRKPRTKDDKENVEREGERSRKKKPTEELEDEQKKLDEEMERRRRRVQQWLKFRRKKKEAEGEKHREVDVDEPNSVKTWTLEGESDDEETGMDVDGEAYRTDKEDGAVLEVDSENETAAPTLQDDEIDPLDAFIILRIIPGEDSDSDYGDIENNDNPLEDEDDDEFTKRLDEPIGLIMAPSRELVQQIHSVIFKFAKALSLTLRFVPVYGGSGIAQQTGELKLGAAFVVCTPGRMIDILCTNAGRITNLQRVTYLVVDEVDQMFDLGFGLQINRSVQSIPSDHQTVLFSAIFPHQGAARAAAIAVAMNLKHNLAKIQADAMPEHFEVEGQYFPPGKVPGPGDPKVFLLIEGPTEQSVKRGKAELKRKLEEIMNQALSLPGGAQPRIYQLYKRTRFLPTFCIILPVFAELNLPLSSWFIISQSPNECSF
ncbi:hypothetical protein C1H46_030539 [Malus baccata]|uniref:Helicase ATP-binding domain-containing protein n=1 Tax=Malus baccata TaxID=106549 RepID=A0A540LBT8_MALBA|nr:hypothetical protein C1H46_030539 [Malus baccata]